MSIPAVAELEALLAQAESGSVDPKKIEWLSGLIDHTSLKTDVTEEQIRALCREAREYHFAAVCVRLKFVPLCVEELKGTGVQVACVVGFHTGLDSTDSKVKETLKATKLGATEIDMVINGEKLKAGDSAAVYEDIRQVALAAGAAPVKAILETSQLSEEQKHQAATLAKAAKAAFLKTSTGFVPGGATVEDVALLRSVAKDNMGVKASGGIRTLADALRVVIAGANRIGTSSGVAIMGGKSPQNSQTGVY